MNLLLRDVYETSADGLSFWQMDEAYVRGANVRLGSPRSVLTMQIKYIRVSEGVLDKVKLQEAEQRQVRRCLRPAALTVAARGSSWSGADARRRERTRGSERARRGSWRTRRRSRRAGSRWAWERRQWRRIGPRSRRVIVVCGRLHRPHVLWRACATAWKYGQARPAYRCGTSCRRKRCTSAAVISNAIWQVSVSLWCLLTSIWTGSSLAIDAKAALMSDSVKPARVSLPLHRRQRTATMRYESSRGLGRLRIVAQLIDHDELAARLEPPRQGRDRSSDVLDVVHDLGSDNDVELLAV